jgi:hypothetical protein
MAPPSSRSRFSGLHLTRSFTVTVARSVSAQCCSSNVGGLSSFARLTQRLSLPSAKRHGARRQSPGERIGGIHRPVIASHVSVEFLKRAERKFDRPVPSVGARWGKDPVLLAARCVTAIERRRLMNVPPAYFRRSLWNRRWRAWPVIHREDRCRGDRRTASGAWHSVPSRLANAEKTILMPLG